MFVQALEREAADVTGELRLSRCDVGGGRGPRRVHDRREIEGGRKALSEVAGRREVRQRGRGCEAREVSIVRVNGFSTAKD